MYQMLEYDLHRPAAAIWVISYDRTKFIGIFFIKSYLMSRPRFVGGAVERLIFDEWGLDVICTYLGLVWAIEFNQRW